MQLDAITNRAAGRLRLLLTGPAPPHLGAPAAPAAADASPATMPSKFPLDAPANEPVSLPLANDLNVGTLRMPACA